MPNSIDLYKRISLHVVPAPIIVPCWEAHQNILPIFRKVCTINYLRYRPLYLENMRRLPEEHADIYTNFMQNHFEVK